MDFSLIRHWWIFIDWQNVLNKQTAMHGVAVYSLRRGLSWRNILVVLKTSKVADHLDKMVSAAREKLLKRSGAFLSAARRTRFVGQSGLDDSGRSCFSRSRCRYSARSPKSSEAVRPAGPYLYHYVVEAMLHCGLNEEARDLLYSYWGGMADAAPKLLGSFSTLNIRCFPPYNNHLITSYCHAWIGQTPRWPTTSSTSAPNLFGDTYEATKKQSVI
jgi:hypothetical protein